MFRFPVVCLLLVAALNIAISATGDEPKAPDFAPVVQGNNAFAVALYAKLRTEKGNLFFSPYSISTALAMTYAGAEGKTATEMAAVLRLTLPQDQLPPAFAALAAKLHGDTKTQGYQLRIANRLWGQTGYSFLPTFLQITRDDFGTELGQVDFGRTENARQTINTWVEEKTEKKIEALIGEGVLDAATRLVLTNAIYFKGNWDKPFDGKATAYGIFRATTKARFKVPMMFQSGNFPFRIVDRIQVLELPYVKKDLSMVVILPKEVNGLADLEKQLTAETLGTWTSDLREHGLKVYLPRFMMNSDFRLDQVLCSMGMPLVFSSDADLSGMTGNRDLFLSAVVHKAFIEVNEEGTEAAAATGGGGSWGLPPVFRVDHPFLFLIRDNRTGSILFLGRVVNPNEGLKAKKTTPRKRRPYS